MQSDILSDVYLVWIVAKTLIFVSPGLDPPTILFKIFLVHDVLRFAAASKMEFLYVRT